MIKDLKPESDRLISRLRAESILQRILTIRGRIVVLDLDLAALSPVLPFAFTEHETIMATSVLNSLRAVETSVFVVRAFVRIRETLASHQELAHRLEKLEMTYDARFRVVFDAIRALMEPPKTPRRRIGF
jgi:hypothetical protein